MAQSDLEKAARQSVMGRIGTALAPKQKKEEAKVPKVQKPYAAPPKGRGPYWGVAKTEEAKPEPKRKRGPSKY